MGIVSSRLFVVLCYTKIETKSIHSSPEHMLGFSRHKSTCLILPSCGCWGSWFSPRTSPDKREAGVWPLLHLGLLLLSWKWTRGGENKDQWGTAAPLHPLRCYSWHQVRSFTSCAEPAWNSMCSLHALPPSAPPLPEPIYAEETTVKRKLS